MYMLFFFVFIFHLLKILIAKLQLKRTFYADDVIGIW